jgi:hypothetical protein
MATLLKTAFSLWVVQSLLGLKCAKLLPGAKWPLIWPEKRFCGEFLPVISLFARFI